MSSRKSRTRAEASGGDVPKMIEVVDLEAEEEEAAATVGSGGTSQQRKEYTYSRVLRNNPLYEAGYSGGETGQANLQPLQRLEESKVTTAHPRNFEFRDTDCGDWGKAPTSFYDEDATEIGSRVYPNLNIFKLPAMINIRPVGAFIPEGTSMECVSGDIISPSEFYLVEVPKFHDMITFTNNMSTAYKEWSRNRQMDSGVVGDRPIFMKYGGFVGCYSGRAFQANIPRERIKEIGRAKIVGEIAGSNSNCLQAPLAERRYKLLLIDRGEYMVSDLKSIFFLHKKFVEAPSWSIRCRLQLDPSLEMYHTELAKWSRNVTRFMRDILADNRFQVKFLRKLNSDQTCEPVWEVSISLPSRPGWTVEEGIMKLQSQGNDTRLDFVTY